MFKQVLAAGAAMGLALAISAPASATVYLSTSTTASSPGGATPVLSFSAPGGTQVKVTVTDCCVGGDYYSTFLDGALIGTTPFEPQYGSVLSTGTFLAMLGVGGTHTVQMFDQTNFLLPAGLSVLVESAVPEPTTWALMIMGMFGMGYALRSSRKAVLAA